MTFPLETIYTEVQKRPFRKLLSHLQFSGSIGGGLTFIRQDLVNLGFFQGSSQRPVIYNLAQPSPTSGLADWSVSPVTVNPLAITTNPGDVRISTDTQNLSYTGQGLNLPVELAVTTRINRFRVGFGAGMDYFAVGNLAPVQENLSLRSITYSDKTLSYRKLYLSVGYDCYRIQDWVLSADIQVGTIIPGKAYKLENVTGRGLYSVGGTVRKELTEYFSVFARPSVTLKNFRSSPFSTDGYVGQQDKVINFSAGVIIGFPDLPRCFVKTCGIQMNHPHGNKEYRSRVHPIYKRQNPGYGENYGPRVKPVGTKPKK